MPNISGVFIYLPLALGGEKVSEKAIAAKQLIVDEIKEKIEGAQSVTLVGFDRMDVKEVTELRNLSLIHI